MNRSHSYDKAFEAWIATQPSTDRLEKIVAKHAWDAAVERVRGPDVFELADERDAGLEAAALLCESEAEACQPGSAGEQQNWPFALQTTANMIRALKRTSVKPLAATGQSPNSKEKS